MVAFISCSKTKKRFPCKAKDMYQGNLFKKAYQFAIKNYNNVYILSAKYGVLHPEEIITPYDLTLKNFNKDEINAWYKLVESQIKNLDQPFVFFTGKLYHQPFKGEKPLEGLSLGKQLQWFNLKLKKMKGLFYE